VPPASAAAATKAEQISAQSAAQPEISQVSYTCHAMGAIVSVEVTNPTAAEVSRFVLLGGVKLGVQQDQTITVPAAGAAVVEFHGIPRDRYLVQLLDAEGRVGDRARVRVKCALGTVPAAVVAVAGTGGGSGEVQVDWNAVPGATGYQVLQTNTAGRHARVVADFNITTGRTRAAPQVTNIWSAEHSYIPDRGPLTRVDQSPWFQYVDVLSVAGQRCYRVLAYNTAGHGPKSAVTCAAPPGG
jgi:hypothetical protein